MIVESPGAELYVSAAVPPDVENRFCVAVLPGAENWFCVAVLPGAENWFSAVVPSDAESPVLFASPSAADYRFSPAASLDAGSCVLAVAWSDAENWALTVASPACCSAGFAVAKDSDNSLS